MAVGRIAIHGTQRVIMNLAREVKSVEKRTQAGMWRAAMMIKRYSMQLTPVDTGNLKGSAYTQAITIRRSPAIEIGYTAAYALYVHEIDRTHKSPTQWKFLETALKEKRKEVLEILARSAKV